MKDIIIQLKSISLNDWDKIFLTIFTSFVIWYTFYDMTILALGGIILIYGAFLTYKGQIYLSVWAYLSADTCWIINAWERDDWQGAMFITLGMLFGVLSSWKMRNGKMEKDLLKKC